MSEPTSAAPIKHVKFAQDDIGNDSMTLTAVDEPAKPDSIKVTTNNFSDDDSDDDSDAPVEEGISQSKSAIEAQLKQRDVAIQQEKESLKAKRRRQDALFKEQQAAKRSRIEEQTKNAEEGMQDREEKEEEEGEEEEEVEQLQALDEELLRTIDTPDIVTKKHINFAKLEAAEALQLQERDRVRRKKVNMLKALRRQTVKRGPVNVTVLASESSLRVMAPQRETKVTNLRDKWLSRKSLRKKK